MPIAPVSPRIILATIGSAGDVNPMIALGRGLLALGHDVTLVTSPIFAAHIEQAGIPFQPLGTVEEHLRVVEDPDLWDARRAFGVIARGVIIPAMRPFFDRYADADPADTLLVTSALVLGAHLLREARGIPHVTVHLQPSLLRSVHHAPNLGGVALPDRLPAFLKRLYYRLVDRFVIDPLLAPGANAFRAELGLPAISRFFGDWLHSPLLNLCLFPEWFAPSQPDWPPHTRLTGFIEYDGGDIAPLDPDLDAWLAAGEPPIVFTPGSSNIHAADFLRESAEAARLLERRALLVAREPEQAPLDLPAGVRAVPFAPFSRLLPRVAALIYHGGIGTLAQAVAAGIPHLVMPLSHDQPDNADRLKRLGVGDALSPAGYRAPAVARKLDALLTDPAVRDRCRQLAAQIDFPAALVDACREIERAHLR